MRTLALLLLAAALARADYSLPAAAETFHRVYQDWTVDGLDLRAGGGVHRIDLFWLADRIDSDTICCGRHEEAMRKYLAGLDRKLPIVAELVAVKKGEKPFVAGLWPLTAERVCEHLALEAKLVGPAERKAGEPIELKIELVNRSKVPHKVVLPNDGSESRMREPHTFFSARLDGRELTPGPVLRCGLFAEDWHRDVVELKPGERLRIDDRYLPPSVTLDLSRPGKLELRVHYAYTGGRSARGTGELDPGPMGRTPAFELVSEPVAIALR